MNRLVAHLVRVFIRWMPDAFAVAILLTLLTVVLAVVVADYPLKSAVEAWGDGFWNLLTFTNQISLTLLFGYAFANTPPVRRGLLRIAGLVTSAPMAYGLACFITGVLALFSWGLSLVAAGIMARAVGEACLRKGIRVHYPLLVASSFSGFVIWHQGLTSSVGLAIATPGNFLEEQIGLIATSQTVFTPWNIAVALFVLFTLPLVMASLRPADEDIEEMNVPQDVVPQERENTEVTPARFLERSPAVSLPIVAMGLFFLGVHFFARDKGLELNILNFAFLIAGLALAGSAVKYAEVIADGGRVVAPFLLQYPFYAGIAGLMGDSGLARMVVEAFVSISIPTTLPVFAFLSGGLLNIFIPSGGGQWAVQGPIMMAAAQEVGADLPRVAMGVALGDQWTNLIQPLVLMPVLMIARIGAREIMGYTFVALFWTGAVFSLSLLLF
ncbi:MAG: TIGR00366 family protein [Candidatus Binatia bacterium]|nr:TIGR00366 family protein [Candidatus Binatia bacterium]